MTRIKVCGLARRDDALHAVDVGVDFVGFVFTESARQAEPRIVRDWVREIRRRAPHARTVGVGREGEPEFFSRCLQAEVDFVQLHCSTPVRSGPVLPSESRLPIILALSGAALSSVGEETRRDLERAASDADGPGLDLWALLGDSAATNGPSDRTGGAGHPFDWSLVPAWTTELRFFLAGGLSPETVAAAIAQVAPWAVDASSRLERSPGEKDPARVVAFLEAVRRADATPTVARSRP